MTYIATFYTHAGALVSSRNMKKAGITHRMMPVPRVLSSSCGTCIRYEAEDPGEKFLDTDIEAIYLSENGNYTLIRKFD